MGTECVSISPCRFKIFAKHCSEVSHIQINYIILVNGFNARVSVVLLVWSFLKTTVVSFYVWTTWAEVNFRIKSDKCLTVDYHRLTNNFLLLLICPNIATNNSSFQTSLSLMIALDTRQKFNKGHFLKAPFGVSLAKHHLLFRTHVCLTFNWSYSEKLRWQTSLGTINNIQNMYSKLPWNHALTQSGSCLLTR